jgi:hypothetical protein
MIQKPEMLGLEANVALVLPTGTSPVVFELLPYWQTRSKGSSFKKKLKILCLCEFLSQRWHKDEKSQNDCVARRFAVQAWRVVEG